MYVFTSLVFHNVSLAAGHHHPDMWHQGDSIPEEMDFGVFQLCAVGDRPVIDMNPFISACCYGQHAVHHLFPTVDQSKLGLLIPVLKDTCEEFFSKGIDSSNDSDVSSQDFDITSEFLKKRQMSPVDGFVGMVRQLLRGESSDKNAIFYSKK